MLKKLTGKSIAIIVLVLVMLISFFPIGRKMGNLNTYKSQIEYLDKKSGDALALTAIAATASTTISLLPDDIGSSISNELMDLTSYFGIALAVLMLEKYMLPLIGFAVFKVLIPISCVLIIISLVRNNPSLKNLAKKLILFGIAISLIIPTSVAASKAIEDVYGFTIEDVQEESVTLSEEKDDSVSYNQNNSENSNNAGIWQTITHGIAKGATTVVTTAKKLGNTIKDAAKTVLSNTQKLLTGLLEKLAVLLVTSCLLPILVILAFVFVTKAILGIDFTETLYKANAKRKNIVNAFSPAKEKDDKLLADGGEN